MGDLTNELQKYTRKTLEASKAVKSLLFDVETTGLIENRVVKDERLPEVIEIYACLCDTSTGDIFAELETLVRPRKLDFPPKITEITGIRPEDLIGKPMFADIQDRLYEMIFHADRVITHNCSFDCEAIDIEYMRLGGHIDWPEKICTVEQTIHLQGFRMGLSVLHSYLFGEKFEGAHRAKADVMALLRCVQELERRNIL